MGMYLSKEDDAALISLLEKYGNAASQTCYTLIVEAIHAYANKRDTYERYLVAVFAMTGDDAKLHQAYQDLVGKGNADPSSMSELAKAKQLINTLRVGLMLMDTDTQLSVHRLEDLSNTALYSQRLVQEAKEGK